MPRKRKITKPRPRSELLPVSEMTVSQLSSEHGIPLIVIYDGEARGLGCKDILAVYYEVTGMTQKEAYRKAKRPECSEEYSDSLSSTASRFFAKREVQEFRRVMCANLMIIHDETLKQLMNELKEVAFGKISDWIEVRIHPETGTPSLRVKDFSQCTNLGGLDELSIAYGRDGVTMTGLKVKCNPRKVDALQKLSSYHGLMGDINDALSALHHNNYLVQTTPYGFVAIDRTKMDPGDNPDQYAIEAAVKQLVSANCEIQINNDGFVVKIPTPEMKSAE